MKSLLLSRNYKIGMINAAIEKAKSVSRTEALNRAEKSEVTRRPVFKVQYDPRLPSISGIVKNIGDL